MYTSESEEGVFGLPNNNPSASLESSICINALTSFVNLTSNIDSRRNRFLHAAKKGRNCDWFSCQFYVFLYVLKSIRSSFIAWTSGVAYVWILVDFSFWASCHYSSYTIPLDLQIQKLNKVSAWKFFCLQLLILLKKVEMKSDESETRWQLNKCLQLKPDL